MSNYPDGVTPRDIPGWRLQDDDPCWQWFLMDNDNPDSGLFEQFLAESIEEAPFLDPVLQRLIGDIYRIGHEIEDQSFRQAWIAYLRKEYELE